MPISPRSRVLAMNQGSSTLKASLYEVGRREQLLFSIAADEGRGTSAQVKITDAHGAAVLDSKFKTPQSTAILDAIFHWLEQGQHLSDLASVGHRLVHGGVRYQKSCRITAKVLRDLERLIPLDPEHLPQALRDIRFVSKRFPKLPQIASFDTAFHSSLPQVARMYALPRNLYQAGIRRFGFHGLSYEFILQELRVLDARAARGRVIIAHLGNGASMAAIREGKSIDTSMGLTPLEGLVMGTRSGDVDPGALIYLLRQNRAAMNAKSLDRLLNKESGLLGVSGESSDMRDLLRRAPSDPRAAEAVDLFCYRAKKYIGAYAAALGGLDTLVFTGGIGEHAPVIRERICSGLDFLGVQLDARRNQANAPVISASRSRVKVRVIQTDEDRMIVRHVLAVLGQRKSQSS